MSVLEIKEMRVILRSFGGLALQVQLKNPKLLHFQAVHLCQTESFESRENTYPRAEMGSLKGQWSEEGLEVPNLLSGYP